MHGFASGAIWPPEGEAPKTERTYIDENVISSAITDVREGRLSIRKAADKYNLKVVTLQHRKKGD